MKQISRSVFELGSWDPSPSAREPYLRSTPRPLPNPAPAASPLPATGAMSRPLHTPAFAPAPAPNTAEAWQLGADLVYAMDGRLTHRSSGLHLALNDSERRLLEALMVARTLSKDQVLERVWRAKGIVVSDSSYYKLVSTLRRKLRTVAGEQEFIRVIPRLGLELCCSMTPAVPIQTAVPAAPVESQAKAKAKALEIAATPARGAGSTATRLAGRLPDRLAWRLAAILLMLLVTLIAVLQLRLFFAA